MTLTPDEERGAGGRARQLFRVGDHAVLLLADRPRAPVAARCACRSIPRARRAGRRAGRARRSARRGQPLARAGDRPPLPGPRACCWRSIAAPSTAATATAAGWWGRRSRRSRATISSAALDYIRRTPAIRDVLISGGDPLTLSTARLEEIVAALRAIPHVEIIRIGTRVPVVLPMRIDDELCAMLKQLPPALHQHALQPPQGADAARRAPRASGWPTPASRSATRRCCCAA